MELQISNVTVRTVAIVFKLDQNKPIYLLDEVDGEVIIPNEIGDFDILSLVDGSVYTVEFEERLDVPPQVPVPTSFSRRNPPLGVISSSLPLLVRLLRFILVTTMPLVLLVLL